MFAYKMHELPPIALTVSGIGAIIKNKDRGCVFQE